MLEQRLWGLSPQIYKGFKRPEFDNVVEGLVGFAVGSFDFGQWRGSLSGASLEEAVGQRTADALMEEHK